MDTHRDEIEALDDYDRMASEMELITHGPINRRLVPVGDGYRWYGSRRSDAGRFLPDPVTREDIEAFESCTIDVFAQFA